MTGFTPGPWSAFDTDGKPINDPSIVSEKHVLATVWINDLSRKQAVANARLIAAAPELLKQLKGLLGFVNFVIDEIDIDPETTEVILRLAGVSVATVPLSVVIENSKAAIASAEGN